jgi:hypothetical protein
MKETMAEWEESQNRIHAFHSTFSSSEFLCLLFFSTTSAVTGMRSRLGVLLEHKFIQRLGSMMYIGRMRFKIF